MSNVSYETAWKLKLGGHPQAEPAFGQIWYTGQRDTKIVICGPIDFEGDYPHVPDHHTAIYSGEKEDWAFAPDLDFITAYLPEGFILEMWDGRHSCKIETEETTIRTMAENFAEAAALVFLELKQNAPGQTFVQPGDAEQE